MNRIILRSLSVCLVLCLAPGAVALDAWVCSDLYHVNPVDGAILELGGPAGEDFKKSNEIWDGGARSINLVGARNETVAFQVVLEGEGKGLDVVVEDWRGPTNFPAKAVKGFFVWNTKGDALVPMILPGSRPFSLPMDHEPVKPLASQAVQPIWVDISIPKGIEKGEYTAIVSVTSGGKTLRSMKLNLEVLDLDLPERRTIPGLLRWRGSRYLKRWGGFPDYAYKVQMFNIEMIAYRMFWQHGCEAYVQWMDPSSGEPYSEAAPKYAGEGANQTVKRWDFWDRRFGDVLGQTWGLQPPTFFQIPISATWPVSYSLYSEDPDAYQKALQDILGEFARHLRTSGFTKSHFVFSGGVRKSKEVPVNLVSPSSAKDTEAVRMYADIVRSVASKEKVNLSYQVETAGFCAKGDSLQNVGVWILPAPDFSDAACSGRVAERVKKGVSFVASMEIPGVTDPSTATLGSIWRLWGRGVRSIAYQYCGELAYIDGDSVSTFFYEGEKADRRALIPSIRLKHIRRGLQDLEYMELASKLKGKSVADIQESMNAYSGASPARMHEGRLFLARMLAGGDA